MSSTPDHHDTNATEDSGEMKFTLSAFQSKEPNKIFYTRNGKPATSKDWCIAGAHVATVFAGNLFAGLLVFPRNQRIITRVGMVVYPWYSLVVGLSLSSLVPWRRMVDGVTNLVKPPPVPLSSPTEPKDANINSTPSNDSVEQALMYIDGR